MKAERRHELKQNTLAHQLENAPAFFQQYGSRILLGVILCLLAYILVNNHRAEKTRRARAASDALGSALFTLNELRGMSARSMSPDALVRARRDFARDADEQITSAIEKAEDPNIRAQAFVARGDLNWALANFPELPTTQPDSRSTKSSDEYMKAAEEAYDEVTRPPLNENAASLVAARFSLAAIAENRGQWEKAGGLYQQLADDSSLGQRTRDFAALRKSELVELQKPVVIGSEPAPRPTTQATGNSTGIFGQLAPSAISGLPSSLNPQPGTGSASPTSWPAPIRSDATPAVAPVTQPTSKP